MLDADVDVGAPAPGGVARIGLVDLDADCRAIPLRKQLQLGQPLLEPVRLEPRHGRVLVKMDEDVRRNLVELTLPLRVGVQRLA